MDYNKQLETLSDLSVQHGMTSWCSGTKEKCSDDDDACVASHKDSQPWYTHTRQ